MDFGSLIMLRNLPIMKKVKCKSLYVGYFNFIHETFIERCYAGSERQAWFLFCKRLAKKKEISEKQVMQIFSGAKENFKIIKEVEFREVENVG